MSLRNSIRQNISRPTLFSSFVALGLIATQHSARSQEPMPPTVGPQEGPVMVDNCPRQGWTTDVTFYGLPEKIPTFGAMVHIPQTFFEIPVRGIIVKGENSRDMNPRALEAGFIPGSLDLNGPDVRGYLACVTQALFLKRFLPKPGL